MNEIDNERPTCPICLDETYGRPCETSYCAGHRVGHQRGYEAGHHDGLADGMARATAAYEAGRLAAVRAEVERAMPDLTKEVISANRGHHNATGDALEDMRRHRSTGTAYVQGGAGHPAWDLGYEIGRVSYAARRQRRACRIVADVTRWLEATR